MDDDTNLADLQVCATEALRAWSLSGASTTFVTARENAVFRVDTPTGGSFALRIHRPGYHSLAELESEVDWTDALRTSGIETPIPVRTRTGTAYATVPFGTNGDTRQVGLTEWIDGTPLDQILASADPLPIYREIGVLMASMHDQAQAWTPGPGFIRHSLDTDGLVGDAPWWGPFWDLPEMTREQTGIVQAARHRLEQTLGDYGTRRPTFGLIHADLLPQNVLVRDGHPVVIDFDDAAFGWHQYDMAVALVPFVGHPGHSAVEQALLEGYRTVRSFTPEDEALLPDFRAVRALVELGWMHTRVAQLMPLASGRTVSRPEVLLPRISRAVALCESVLVRSKVPTKRRVPTTNPSSRRRR